MGDYIKKGCNSFNVKLTVYILITYSSFYFKSISNVLEYGFH
uniref:Uncharacterized protein n=1 Tax=Anguilla anguilla TaxID=7936 RepID=A0A0E9PNZ5_ANGAN